MRSLQSDQIIQIENVPPSQRAQKSITSRRYHFVPLFDKHDAITFLHLPAPPTHKFLLRPEMRPQLPKCWPAPSDVGLTPGHLNVTHFPPPLLGDSTSQSFFSLAFSSFAECAPRAVRHHFSTPNRTELRILWASSAIVGPAGRISRCENPPRSSMVSARIIQASVILAIQRQSCGNISRNEPARPGPISGHFLHFSPPERSTSSCLSTTYTLFCENTGMPTLRVSGGPVRTRRANKSVLPSRHWFALISLSCEGSLVEGPPVYPDPRGVTCHFPSKRRPPVTEHRPRITDHAYIHQSPATTHLLL
jgi:hypothetical protein